MNRNSSKIQTVLFGTILLFGQTAWAQLPTSHKGEERLVREVRRELVMLPYYSVFENLEYKVTGDEVVLQGQVTRPTLKSDAENAVKRIEGVTKVTNNIEVLPPSPADDQIRRAIYWSLFSQDSPLMRYAQGAVPPIHIIVKNGTVALEGVVNRESDKTTATMLAKKVSGTFSVTNNLRVEKE